MPVVPFSSKEPESLDESLRPSRTHMLMAKGLLAKLKEAEELMELKQSLKSRVESIEEGPGKRTEQDL